MFFNSQPTISHLRRACLRPVGSPQLPVFEPWAEVKLSNDDRSVVIERLESTALDDWDEKESLFGPVAKSFYSCLFAVCHLSKWPVYDRKVRGMLLQPASSQPGLVRGTVALLFGLAPHQARRRFVEWAQNEIAVVPDFHKRILFSDEAHFWLNGYGNKQNCRIGSEAYPQVYVETPLNPEKLTVWCALSAGGILLQKMMKATTLQSMELWFQQEGATCHTARATIDLLKDTFGDRLISRIGPVNWPLRSCDLTPLDYFLWGYGKSLVYADKPQTLDHLEDNIRRVIADIRPQMLEKVIESWTSRLDYIRASRGSPMPEIIFKM
ncbi:putative transposable element [Trichonephila clavipes]|uniref:Putative transposable element n=1 Tax=Trichonephila clavipes TaxID=2585209 RepID=A0A8X6WEW8_TRICX|nr:putative transposable element [Trichonephila clavipes]